MFSPRDNYNPTLSPLPLSGRKESEKMRKSYKIICRIDATNHFPQIFPIIVFFLCFMVFCGIFGKMNALLTDNLQPEMRPMSVVDRRKKYMVTRSKSDRRPSLVKDWDCVHRRTLSLFAKVSEKQKLALAAENAALGRSSDSVNVLNNVITPTDEEAAGRKLELKYSARTDEYRRPTNSYFNKEQRWNSLVFAERNMELVTEHRQMAEIDHVMVYLSRNPGTNSSYIQWKFDFSETGLRVAQFALRFVYDTLEDGHVRVYLKRDAEDEDDFGIIARPATEAGGDCQTIPVFSSPILRQIPEVQGWNRFSLVAELSCKRGACVFHHSQLFLQQRSAGFFEKDVKKYPFKVDISLY